jgi:hypothetical protein
MPLDVQQAVQNMKRDGTIKAARGMSKSDQIDVLSEFDRSIVGTCVRLQIPTRDPVELARHMRLLIGVAERIVLEAERGGRKDRSILFSARGELRLLNQKLNAFPSGRKP